MKTRLTRISPAQLAFLLGFFGFIVSIPVVIFAFIAIGPGRTVSLSGFFNLTFTDELNPVLVLAYPFLNAVMGMVSGFIIGLIYNFYAHLFGGISIHLVPETQEAPQPARQPPAAAGRYRV